MDDKKKVRYDVFVNKKKITFYMDFDKEYEDTILGSQENSLSFSGYMYLDSSVVSNIENLMFSSTKIKLDLPTGTEISDSTVDKTKKEEPVKEKVREEEKTEDTFLPEIPSIDLPPVPENKGEASKKTEPKKVQTESKEDGIKDVQILAITTQVELNKANYKELVMEALEIAGTPVETVPPIEELTYRQAIEVIKYGNKKFKR